MSGRGVLHVESSGELERRSDAELLKVYNAVTRTNHTELPAPRAQIIERILLVLARRSEKPEKLAPPKKKPKGRISRRKPFNMPPRRVINDVPPKSILAPMLVMLRQGATVEQLVKAIGRNQYRIVADIRRIRQELGYGLREDENGVIRATTVEEEVME